MSSWQSSSSSRRPSSDMREPGRAPATLAERGGALTPSPMPGTGPDGREVGASPPDEGRGPARDELAEHLPSGLVDLPGRKTYREARTHRADTGRVDRVGDKPAV